MFKSYFIVLFTFSIILAEYSSENISIAGRWPYGDCRSVQVVNSYAYVGNGTVMDVIDISNPAVPEKVAEFITESIIADIHIDSTFAYIANWSDGLSIVNISYPLNPVAAGSLEFPDQCWSVNVVDGIAYLANNMEGIRFIDVNDPNNPILINTLQFGNASIEYIDVVDSIGYVASQEGFYILNLSDISQPEILSEMHNLNTWSVQVENGLAYIPARYYATNESAALLIVDVSNPIDPIIVSATDLDANNAVVDIDIYGSYCYITENNRGVGIFDVSDPADPQLAAQISGYWGYRVEVSNDTLHLASSSDGYYSFNVNDPTNPILIGHYKTSGYNNSVYVHNDTVYSAQYDRGLEIIDFSQPDQPVLIGEIDSLNISHVMGFGDYIYNPY